MAIGAPRFLLLLAALALLRRSHAQFGLNDLMGMFRSWPFQCQAPVPLGQPCVEDYDCDFETQGHHCHIGRRVCAEGQPEGAPCNGGNGTVWFARGAFGAWMDWRGLID